LVLGYLRHSPIERGKYRVMRLLGPSLLIELEPGLFIRPSGLSAVEVAIIRRGMFEPETVHAFAALLSPGMTVLDIGANVDLFTLVAAHRVKPTGSFHSFEPTPELAAHIVRNLELNGLENVIVSQSAVNDTSGHAMLHLVEADDPGENSIVNPSPDARTLEVATVTLDEYIAEHNVGRVDVIKIDIEGAEMPALLGAAELLSRDESPVLVLEFHPSTLAYGGRCPDDMLGLLASHGYAFFPIAAYSLQTHDPYMNGIAAKPEHIDRFSALQRWRQQPLTGWDPGKFKSLEYRPLV
jgi:FkbM family methyltransferase